jgi:hypothetical protein
VSRMTVVIWPVDDLVTIELVRVPVPTEPAGQPRPVGPVPVKEHTQATTIKGVAPDVACSRPGTP